MKFNLAWSQVLTQNVILRFSLASLAIAVIGLTIIVSKLSMKDPIVIERACFSSVLEKASGERTEVEIFSFLKEALAMRFDSETAPEPSYLSEAEVGFREQEQADLKSKQLKQKLVVHGVKKGTGNTLQIDADRLIVAGVVRSALPLPLTATIASVRRLRANPYGLQLVNIKTTDDKK